MRLTRSLGTSVLAGAALLSLVAGGAVVWRAHRSLDAARTESSEAGRVGFTFGPLRVAPNPGFEPLGEAPALASAAAFAGHLFAAGPSGLEISEADGETRARLRPGIELPPAPLAKLLVARPPGSSRPALLIATAGAGLLVLTAPEGGGGDAQTWAAGLRQLLPADPGMRDVTAIAALPGGDLLLGTRRSGLLRFDGTRLELFRPEYRRAGITALLTRGDEVWAGTQDDGLLHTHGGVTEHFTATEGETGALPDRHVASLAAGPAGELYAGTPLGVEAFDPQGRPARRLAAGVFAQSLAAEAQTLTVGTLEQGAIALRLGAEERARRRWQSAAPGPAADAVPENVGSGRVDDLLRLPDGGTLVAVHPDGLYRLGAGGVWTRAAGEEARGLGFASRNVAALMAEPGGRLWVGYFDRGLDVADLASSSPAVRHLEDDHLFCINRLMLDPARGTAVAATANGLVLFDAAGKPRQVLGRRDGLLSEHVSDVSFSPERMAVATTAGLTFLGPAGAEGLYAFQGLVNNHVYALAGGGDELVAGTLGGLSVLERDAVRTNLTVANSGLKHNWVTALAAVNGDYLVGTYGAGVMRLTREGQVAPLSGATRAMVVNNNALLVTPDHVLAGSLGQGLWVENRHSGRWTQVTGGLPSLNVTAFAERDGAIFVGTENGLVRIVEGRLP